MLLQMTLFHSFLWLSNIPLYRCTTHLLYPFICQWTFRLFPYLGYCFALSVCLLSSFFFIFFNWSLVDLQCCVSFRCTAKWFSYTYTCVMYVLSQLGARREPRRSRCFPDVLAAVKDGHVTLGTHWAPAQRPRMAEHRGTERQGPCCLCWAHHTQFWNIPTSGFLITEHSF